MVKPKRSPCALTVAALCGFEESVLLHEQHVRPGILEAVVRAADPDSRAGRYLVKGSVRAKLGSSLWPRTGLVELVGSHHR